jgi:hypothetical protein
MSGIEKLRLRFLKGNISGRESMIGNGGFRSLILFKY